MNWAELSSWKLKAILEAGWLAVTFLIVLAIMIPIWTKVQDYPFDILNIVFIVVFITFSRYIFFLRYTWLDLWQWPKLLLIAMSVMIVFYLIQGVNQFSSYLDETGLMEIGSELSHHSQKQITDYIRTEFLFFGVGSIIAAIALPVRMLISVWFHLNRKKP